MTFTMIVSRFEKSHCLLKSSVPIPERLNLIKTLATGAICKLKIQTREPHTPSSILFTFYGHDISNMVYVSLTNYFVKVITNISMKFIVVFHVQHVAMTLPSSKFNYLQT